MTRALDDPNQEFLQQNNVAYLLSIPSPLHPLYTLSTASLHPTTGSHQLGHELNNLTHRRVLSLNHPL